MDRYDFIRAMIRASVTTLALSIPLAFVMRALGFYPELNIIIHAANLFLRFLSFLLPLFGLSVWAALQKTYPLFLLIGLGIPALFLSLMGYDLIQFAGPLEALCLYSAMFWPIALAGWKLDREETGEIDSARRPLRVGIWAVIAAILLFQFVLPDSIWPAKWEYLPFLFINAILPMNLIFLLFLHAAAPKEASRI